MANGQTRIIVIERGLLPIAGCLPSINVQRPLLALVHLRQSKQEDFGH